MKIKKETFNELLRVSKKYWDTGDTDFIPKVHELCKELDEQSVNRGWWTFNELSSVFVKLKTDDETCYQIMEKLGFEWEEE